MPTIDYEITVPIKIEYRDTPDGPEVWTYDLPTSFEIYGIVDGEMENIRTAILEKGGDIE